MDELPDDACPHQQAVCVEMLGQADQSHLLGPLWLHRPMKTRTRHWLHISEMLIFAILIGDAEEDRAVSVALNMPACRPGDRWRLLSPYCSSLLLS